jgi:hypothetical protein
MWMFVWQIKKMLIRKNKITRYRCIYRKAEDGKCKEIAAEICETMDAEMCPLRSEKVTPPTRTGGILCSMMI